jgi:hypothetical protein
MARALIRASKSKYHDFTVSCLQMVMTPCTLTIKKNEEFVATFQKDGFLPQQIPVTRHVVAGGVVATAGNVIAGD